MKRMSTSHHHPKKQKRKKRRGRGGGTTSVSHTISHTIHWHINHSYIQEVVVSLWQKREVTCTYLHHTKPHILSPTLPLWAIFWTAGNTWATLCTWGCSRTLPPAWHGTTKAKAIWVHRQRPWSSMCHLHSWRSKHHCRGGFFLSRLPSDGEGESNIRHAAFNAILLI